MGGTSGIGGSGVGSGVGGAPGGPATGGSAPAPSPMAQFAALGSRLFPEGISPGLIPPRFPSFMSSPDPQGSFLPPPVTQQPAPAPPLITPPVARRKKYRRVGSGPATAGEGRR